MDRVARRAAAARSRRLLPMPVAVAARRCCFPLLQRGAVSAPSWRCAKRMHALKNHPSRPHCTLSPQLTANGSGSRAAAATGVARSLGADMEEERRLAAMVCSLENKDSCLMCGS